MNERTPYKDAIDLVDAEYEMLHGITKQELYEYFSGIIDDLTKEESDKIWMTMLG